MAPKKNCKQAQETMLEEPVEDQIVPPESIGEEEPSIQEDQDEPESEEEQRSSVLFTPEQLEVLFKMNRLDFSELGPQRGVIQECRISTGQARELRWCLRLKGYGWLACGDGGLFTCHQGWTTFGHGACPILLERSCRHMVEDNETRRGEEPWLHLGVLQGPH